MDNTLFVGDIGEGLLAFLVSKGMLLESVWVEYKRLLNESRLTPEQRCFNAYSFASIALSGMAPAQVAQATVEMIDLPGEVDPKNWTVE
jgi:hypothetical protein